MKDPAPLFVRLLQKLLADQPPGQAACNLHSHAGMMFQSAALENREAWIDELTRTEHHNAATHAKRVLDRLRSRASKATEDLAFDSFWAGYFCAALIRKEDERKAIAQTKFQVARSKRGRKAPKGSARQFITAIPGWKDMEPKEVAFQAGEAGCKAKADSIRKQAQKMQRDFGR